MQPELIRGRRGKNKHVKFHLDDGLMKICHGGSAAARFGEEQKPSLPD
jgi:hypothetical protein